MRQKERSEGEICDSEPLLVILGALPISWALGIDLDCKIQSYKDLVFSWLYSDAKQVFLL